MIILTRLNGQEFAVNSDLVERVEATPDTVITLVDGNKHLVRESLDEVIGKVVAFRASILVAAEQAHETAEARAAEHKERTAPLRLLPGAAKED